jgi:hypothetical protein
MPTAIKPIIVTSDLVSVRGSLWSKLNHGQRTKLRRLGWDSEGFSRFVGVLFAMLRRFESISLPGPKFRISITTQKPKEENLMFEIDGQSRTITIYLQVGPTEAFSKIPLSLSFHLIDFLFKAVGQMLNPSAWITFGENRGLFEKEATNLFRYFTTEGKKSLNWQEFLGDLKITARQCGVEAAKIKLAVDLIHPLASSRDAIKEEVEAAILHLEKATSKTLLSSETSVTRIIAQLALLSVVARRNRMPEASFRCQNVLYEKLGENLAQIAFLKSGLPHPDNPFVISHRLGMAIKDFSVLFNFFQQVIGDYYDSTRVERK